MGKLHHRRHLHHLQHLEHSNPKRSHKTQNPPQNTILHQNHCRDCSSSLNILPGSSRLSILFCTHNHQLWIAGQEVVLSCGELVKMAQHLQLAGEEEMCQMLDPWLEQCNQKTLHNLPT